jgi:arylsulfatase A-like enzyme
MSAGQRVRRAERVLIISEDGLRGDALTQLKLPWHESLYRHGAYTWKARTIRTASTLPSHAAMLSGFDVDQHGLTWNNWRPDRGYIRVPSIFEDALQHGLHSAMFVGKLKLRHIARPGSVEVFERPGYYCKKVAAEAADYIVREKPPLAFVHFSNPDDAGHSKGWTSGDYDHAVTEDDRCLGVILDALDHAGMTDDTLIIISADHGGHSHTHSGSLSVDREIPWIAHGPGVRANYRIRGSISTVDTAATALDALGLSVPAEAAGRPVTEIYGD